MAGFKPILAAALGLAALIAVAPATALLEDQNHFVIDRSSGSCVLRVDPQRDALNIAFTSPTTLTLESATGFIMGSALKVTFDDGRQLQLGNSSNSSRRIIATITPEQMAGFTGNKRVRIGGDSIRGALYRNIRLQDFAAGYAELKSCTAG